MKIKITKTNIIKFILMVLLLILFTIIFGFSNQNGQESTGVSREVTEKVTANINKIQKLEENEKEEVLLKVEVIVRKMAHFSIYTLVGILLMALVMPDKIRQRNKILCSLWVGFMYAITDELHQIFIPGRTAKVTDVMIDTMGVLLGIGIVMLATRTIRKIKDRIVEVRKLSQKA